MGWCSGTEIFDNIATEVLEDDELTDEQKFNILFATAQSLEKHDWDCQSDSNFYNHPIVVKITKQLHPHWFEDE